MRQLRVAPRLASLFRAVRHMRTVPAESRVVQRSARYPRLPKVGSREKLSKRPVPESRHLHRRLAVVPTGSLARSRTRRRLWVLAVLLAAVVQVMVTWESQAIRRMCQCCQFCPVRASLPVLLRVRRRTSLRARGTVLMKFDLRQIEIEGGGAKGCRNQPTSGQRSCCS